MHFTPGYIDAKSIIIMILFLLVDFKFLWLLDIWYEGWWLLSVNKYMTFVVLSVLDLFLFWLLFYIALLLY